jgi:hypothetical protein
MMIGALVEAIEFPTEAGGEQGIRGEAGRRVLRGGDAGVAGLDGVWVFGGESAEAIQQSRAVLKLEEVYGAITYYVANQKEIDGYLAEGEVEYARLAAEARRKDPELYERLEEIRKTKLVSRP